MSRSLLLHGLRKTLSRPGAVLWTYAFNLGIALLFSVRLHAQLNSVLANSLTSQRLTSAFDLGVLAQSLERLNRDAPATGSSGLIGPAFYLLVYFLLVPGTLFCYQTEAPARLSILLSIGFQRFWRFVRIALMTLLVSALVLLPLLGLQAAWSTHVNATLTGRSALLHTLPGYLLIGFVACLIRLYFDLVEVYTLFLGDQLRPNGRPDRRVRRTLIPALHTLFRNFGRAFLSFLALTLVGLLAVFLTLRISMHMLAQPRVWPMFLLAQLGLFTMLFTRLWQRGAETILCFDNPLPLPKTLAHPSPPILVQPIATASIPPPIPFPPSALTPSLVAEPHPHFPDPQPNPEPASPSLAEPDPGVFHHDPPKT